MTVRASWLESREETRLQAAARLPLAGAAWLYGAAAWAHRGLHRAGTLRTARLSCRVVSVGSLLVGGTGKTPAAAWIAAELHRRGRKLVLEREDEMRTKALWIGGQFHDNIQYPFIHSGRWRHY